MDAAGQGCRHPDRVVVLADTVVLVVGGGPVGLSAAIELQARGVPTLLVTQNLETSTHPKCNSTNARSLEHFRRIGIAAQLRAAGLPLTVTRASTYVTRFCGHELGVLPHTRSDWPTPELPATITQMALERTLRRIAERQPGARIDFGWRLHAFTSSDTGVIATVENVTTNERREIKARYLLGIDGASSTIRRQLGITLLGEDGTRPRAFMGGTMLSYFIRAPGLIAASGRKPTHMTWIVNADMRAMMYLQDDRERWIVHYQVPNGRDAQEIDMRLVIRALLGSDIEFEILSGGPWTGGLALVAEHYQSGSVFLAGDAAHLFTPLGGIGMNTGIGDVMNLCWKFAALHEGWGGPTLLASYEAERRPIGLRNSQLGVRCARVMDGWVLPSNLEEEGPAAEAARKALGAQMVVDDKPQYQTVGLQLGERYDTSPVIWPDDAPAPTDTPGQYVPVDRAGGRAPHFWINEGHSLYDDFGPGFTLLDFGAADQATKLAQAAHERRVPLKILPLAAAPAGLYKHKLVLVRPDHHIAWSGDSVDAPLAVIDRIRGAQTATQ
jgi:2-polyprenyl-6-methoxyphenol hydroxylase-like FAD-dependent oxidoreductase